MRLRSRAYAGLATGWRSPLFAAALLVAFPYRRVRAGLPARPVAAGATPSLPLGVPQFLSPCRWARARSPASWSRFAAPPRPSGAALGLFPGGVEDAPCPEIDRESVTLGKSVAVTVVLRGSLNFNKTQ